MILKLYDGKELFAKFTVEEKNPEHFIMTCWHPDNEAEIDRYVNEFETYSAALAHMYEWAYDTVLQCTNLEQVIGD